MPRIINASRAVPENMVEQNQVRHAITAIFQDHIESLADKLELFDHSRIERRYLVRPLTWYSHSHTAGECNRIYIEESTKLLAQAAAVCLKKSHLDAGDVDHVICVSTTGVATPSIESRIFEKIGLRPETRRTPVWGLGCAGGAAGMALANDLCLANPEARVLLLAVECCSLTFRRDDATVKNLVGTSLFADGAAAVLVAGDKRPSNRPKIIATSSKLFADSERIMGWDVDDNGMQLVLSPQLPQLIEAELAQLVEQFLARHGLEKQDLRFFILHPGGARIIDACKKALGLNEEMSLSEGSLRNYGNVSSVSVLMILEDWLATKPEQNPGYGIMAAFGPGFSAELLLLEA